MKAPLLANLLAAALLVSAATAQEVPPADPFGEVPFDPSVPAPGAVLGHELGDRFSLHHEVLGYLEELDAASDRTILLDYGRTYEGRRLVLVVLSSPERLRRLDSVLEDLGKLADPRRLGDEAEDALLDRTPVCVWLSYNVHGDEASGTETAMAVAYRLAAGTDEATSRWLDECLVVIDPCLNPDGRDRYTSWYRGIAGTRPDPDPRALEQNEPWPGGRENHYGFDLNRDWTWLTQVETGSRLAAYRRFNPQVHVDLHEMDYDSTNFFFPAADPVHVLIPAHVRRWGEIFGRGNAAAFDRRGWPYYTGEIFDLFYPGYGDSWPSLGGAVGMTYEQAGGGSGLAVRRSDGRILTLAERIEHHRVASLATIDTAAAGRRALLGDYLEFRKEGVQGSASRDVACFLVPPGEDPAATAHIVEILMAQGIEVGRATASFYATNARSFEGEEHALKRFDAGTYLVSLAQPLASLARAILEPRPRIPEAKFYDVSAWSLPYSFGLEAYWTPEAVEAPSELLATPPAPEGGISGGPTGFAYLLPWPRRGAPALLSRLLESGFRARVASKEFRIGRRTFRPGTVVWLSGENPPSLGEEIERAAREIGVEVVAAPSGRTDSGVQLGSDEIRRIERPRIALVAGDGVDVSGLGEIRFLLEREHGIPVRLVPPETLSGRHLADYDVVVLADGSYDSDMGGERLKSWIEDGGTLIGIEGGAAYATAAKFVEVEYGEPSTDAGKEEEDTKDGAREQGPGPDDRDPKWVRIKDRETEADEKRIPGTILTVNLDPDHPLAWGLPERVPVLKRGVSTFALTEGLSAVGVFTEKFTLGGYITPRSEEALTRRAFLVHARKGEGHIVLFSDDPNFRLVWKGPSHLFLAALFFLERPPR
ncbi:MAG: hypothetical protein HY720_28860 [Planctomycetes bacterium]|nr:hypothetical protein [Planctomycetota bacterium]